MKITKFIAISLVAMLGLAACEKDCNHNNKLTDVDYSKDLSGACNNTADGEVQSIELLRTGQSWNEMDLPDYPQGKPELVAVKYVIPAGKKLGWHHHVAMNHGVLVQGELTINSQDGKTKVLRAGDVVVEMVDAIHHGENNGTEPVVLYMFYLSQKDMTLTIQHPEIPLE